MKHEWPRAVRRVRSRSPELAPGIWRVEIAAPGHKTHVQRVTLEVNQERRADAELQVGALTDRVEVISPAADLRRDSPAVGTIVENRQILDMPLDGRNFLELTLLAPGTVPAAQGSAGSVRGDFAFSVNGGREDFNSFLLDGADNVDPKLNTTGVRPPVDAIQEFEVLDQHARGGAWPSGGVADQRGDEVGHQPASRHGVHVHQERRARCDQLLRPEERARRRTISAHNPGFRLADPSCAIARSSSPITKPRVPTKGSRALRRCRPKRRETRCRRF